MPLLTNGTRFRPEVFSLLDAAAEEWRVFVLSAAFEARPGAPLQVAEEQLDPRAVDEYHGEPAASSIRYPGDITLDKPAVDVLVVGSAVAQSRSTNIVPVELHVGDVHKQIFVSGNRRWLSDGSPSAAAPFETMPIVYERASAGREPHRANPVGISRGTGDPRGLGTEVPNVQSREELSNPALTPRQPAGLGAIAPWWSPRAEWSGTYDERWMREQAPLLPHDFDVRFFQRAPLDQQSQTIRGGESVRISGMTPEGVWNFELPHLQPEIRLLFERRAEVARLTLDTVLFEPEQYRVTLTGRLLHRVARNTAPLREIVIGPLRRGAWRARLTGKPHRNVSEEHD